VSLQGLRALQQKQELHDLLSSVQHRRDALFRSLRRPAPPLLVKIAPDLTESEKDAIAGVVLDLKLDGLLISNTTVARPPELRSHNQIQTGGLSGAPLKHVTTDLVRDMYRRTNGQQGMKDADAAVYQQSTSTTAAWSACACAVHSCSYCLYCVHAFCGQVPW